MKIPSFSLLTFSAAIKCTSLPVPSNGLKSGCSDPLSERYGTVCSFFCDVGYNLTGSPERQCQENGSWSGVTSSCQGQNNNISTNAIKQTNKRQHTRENKFQMYLIREQTACKFQIHRYMVMRYGQAFASKSFCFNFLMYFVWKISGSGRISFRIQW